MSLYALVHATLGNNCTGIPAEISFSPLEILELRNCYREPFQPKRSECVLTSNTHRIIYDTDYERTGWTCCFLFAGYQILLQPRKLLLETISLKPFNSRNCSVQNISIYTLYTNDKRSLLSIKYIVIFNEVENRLIADSPRVIDSQRKLSPLLFRIDHRMGTDNNTLHRLRHIRSPRFRFRRDRYSSCYHHRRPPNVE